METVDNKIVPNSVRPDVGQIDKRIILKYVAFGFFSFCLYLPAGYFCVSYVMRKNSGISEGQMNPGQINEKTTTLMNLMYVTSGLLAVVLFLTICTKFQRWKIRTGSNSFEEQGNLLQINEKTPSLMNFKFITYGFLAIIFIQLFFSYFLFDEVLGRLEMFMGRENPYQNAEKTTLIILTFVRFGLASVLLFLFNGSIFLFYTIQRYLQAFDTEENPCEIQEKTPRLMKLKFVAFQLLAILLSLSYFSSLIFFEMRGSLEVMEATDNLCETEDEKTSVIIFLFIVIGLITVLFFLISGSIFLYYKMNRCLNIYMAKENPCRTQDNGSSQMNFKLAVFDLLAVLLSLACFSIFIFFEMQGIWIEGDANLLETGEKIHPLRNFECVGLGLLALIPVLKICLIFMVWEIQENLDIFKKNKNPRQTKEKTTYLIYFKNVVFEVLEFLILASFFSFVTYYEMQGNFKILYGMENLTQTEEKTSLSMSFKIVAVGLMAISFFLNIGTAFLFCVERKDLKMFKTQGNARHAKRRTPLLKVEFLVFGYFAILLFLSISRVFFEIRRNLEMLRRSEMLPQMEGKLCY